MNVEEALDCFSEKYKGFYIKKLAFDDPRAGILGKLTNCCQYIGGTGESCAIYGITDPRSGFYVLCKKNSLSEEVIYAQCWAWRDNQNNIVFDSIESLLQFREKNEELICDAFTALAFNIVSEYNVNCVLVGVGGYSATPSSMRIQELTPPTPPQPLDYNGYQLDSQEQSIIAINSQTFMDIYLQKHPTSQLTKNYFKLDEFIGNTWKKISPNFFSMWNFDNNAIRQIILPNTVFIKNTYADDPMTAVNFCINYENPSEKEITSSKTSYLFKKEYNNKYNIIFTYPMSEAIMITSIPKDSVTYKELDKLFMIPNEELSHNANMEESQLIMRIMENHIKNSIDVFDVQKSYEDLSALYTYITYKNKTPPSLTNSMGSDLINFPPLVEKMFVFCLRERWEEGLNLLLKQDALKLLAPELIYNSIGIACDYKGRDLVIALLEKVDLKIHGEKIMLCALQHAAQSDDKSKWKNYMEVVDFLSKNGIIINQEKNIDVWNGGKELIWDIKEESKFEKKKKKYILYLPCKRGLF